MEGRSRSVSYGMRKIVVIAHNLRSAHNVGSLLRTTEGLGVWKVFLTGYTPYPLESNDKRLPHLAQKIDKQINKTALDAQHSIKWQHSVEIEPIIKNLKENGYTVAALEQTDSSLLLADFKPPNKIALIVGREVEGLETEIIKLSDTQLEIPMQGKKESFNVVQAAAMALYTLRYN